MNLNCCKYLFANTLLLLCSNTLQFLLALFVLRKTGSAALFSAMLSVIIVPRIVATPFAGVWGDRFDRKALMKLYFAIYAGICFMFGVLLCYSDDFQMLFVFIFVILIEIIETLYSSVNSSIIPLLVEKEDIGSMTSYAMVGESVSAIFAPVFGAFLMGALEVPISVLVLAFMDILALIIFRFVSLREYETEKKPAEGDGLFIRESVRMISEDAMLRRIVAIAPLVNFFLSPLLSVTYVYYLNEVIRVTGYQYGLFESVCGISIVIGGVISAVLLKKKKIHTILKNSELLIAGGIGIQLAIVLTAGQGHGGFVLLLISSACINTLLAVMNASTSTMFKQQVPIQYMSRMTAFVNLFATVLLPFGQILYGTMADRFAMAYSFLTAFAGMLFVWLLSAKLE